MTTSKIWLEISARGKFGPGLTPLRQELANLPVEPFGAVIGAALVLFVWLSGVKDVYKRKEKSKNFKNSVIGSSRKIEISPDRG